MSLDAVSRAYILTGLRVGEDIEGFVDSYYGPQSLREAAQQSEDALVFLQDLETEVGRMPSNSRRAFFEAQLASLETVLNIQAGRALPYLDEVAAIYQIQPEFTDESVFQAAHYSLDQLLPGDGSLEDRLESYRVQLTINSEQARSVIHHLTGHLRALTSSCFELPDEESASIDFVRNQPWAGYNWYLGNLQSRIEINTDLPIRINSLPDLIAHEIYCGHHTEHALKELHLYRQQGFGEPSIALLTSTQAVISEGIATSALELLIPNSELPQWLREHCYRPAGVDIDIDKDLKIADALRPLRYVSENAALLLHQYGRSESEVVDYIRRWGLRDQEHARQTVRFITTPILRTYIFCYARGYDLVQRYLAESDDRVTAFWSLLTEHWTPQLLREAARPAGK